MSNLSSHDPLLVDELRAALQKAEERRDELRIAWHFEKQRAQKAEEALTLQIVATQVHMQGRAQAEKDLAEIKLQRDALLGEPEAVHIGAQAAITALRQCQQVEEVARELLAALRLAKNTVECASIDRKPGSATQGEELPWYKAAKAAIQRATALLGDPTDSKT